jgi:hypothetical protein
MLVGGENTQVKGIPHIVEGSYDFEGSGSPEFAANNGIVFVVRISDLEVKNPSHGVLNEKESPEKDFKKTNYYNNVLYPDIFTKIISGEIKPSVAVVENTASEFLRNNPIGDMEETTLWLQNDVRTVAQALTPHIFLKLQDDDVVEKSEDGQYQLTGNILDKIRGGQNVVQS